MKGKLLGLFAVAVVGTLLEFSSGWAQVDLAKSLVGKWEGEVTWAASAGGATGDPNRTLIIDSVTQKDGNWVASGRWGITGKGLVKVEIEVGDSAGRPFIRFVTGANSTIRLTLTEAKDLIGTLNIPSLSGAFGRGNERPLRLEKKE
jgi:hypothetical protein